MLLLAVLFLIIIAIPVQSLDADQFNETAPYWKQKKPILEKRVYGMRNLYGQETTNW
jgi:hypothetical protein